ncbi:MAG: hypothetical protein J6S14_15280 [Clostridia bacterium]|nr:hypothetical protein [Clostridia bacterium]
MVSENQKYGRLTTLRCVGTNKHRNKMWECICECGNKVVLSTGVLSTGNTKSCGCLAREHNDKLKEMGVPYRFRKGQNLDEGQTPINTYDLSGEFGVGYTPRGEPFYFDKEDYDLIRPFLWYVKNDGYIITGTHDFKTSMHRMVMGCDDHGMDVHHINHVVYDNRKSNLEICEHYQNIVASKTYSNNTSGRKGVHFDKARNKWCARLTINKKNYYLGRFDTFEEAVAARADAEQKYHVGFIYLE